MVGPDFVTSAWPVGAEGGRLFLMRRSRLIGLAASVLLMPAASWAYDFVPTGLEFTSWPRYCQARYSETNIARQSGFYNRVPPGERRAAEASIGAETYLHVHHHCAGLAWLARAKLEGNPQVRTHMLNRARDESGYTLRNVTPASSLFTAINTNLARVAQAQGKIPLAEEYLNDAIKARPTDPLAYIGLALLYRDTKRLAAARQILETGMTATGSKSVELHYNLGVMCLELKDETCAVEHAQVAYADGYPLPGLKNKLIKQGLWRDQVE
jgi:tetratricopeptide (TPR) repeat protein